MTDFQETGAVRPDRKAGLEPGRARSAASAPLEVKTERDTAIRMNDGKDCRVVRVLYRRPPTRRWTRFLLVPDDGQTMEELEERAGDAAVLHAAGIGAK